MAIRVGAYAVIVRDDALLLIEYTDENGVHYNFPGGGVEDGETVAQALQRELREEAAAELAHVGDQILTWEYVPHQHGFAYGEQQKLGMVFRCDLAAGSMPRLPDNAEAFQSGVMWIPLAQLHDILLLPKVTDILLPILHENQRGIVITGDI